MTKQQNDAGLSALETMFDILAGPPRMAVLQTAVDLALPDLLATAHSPDELARHLNVEASPDNLACLLDAMCALGLAKKTNGYYTNTPLAEDYLRKASPTYLGGMVSNLAGMQHRNLHRIPELVRLGPPAAVERCEQLESEEKWRRSARHLACYQKAGMAERLADEAAALPEFPTMRRMLDLGGGPGITCLTIVGRHPSMRGVLCDLPTVLEVAREEIAAAGMEDRVTTIAGNYNDVNFDTGYDLVWSSHALYYARDLDALLSRIHAALNPGGVFLTVHEGLTEERTGPANIVLSRLSLALEGQDVSFDRGTIAAPLPNAGFAAVETRALDLPFGPFELVTGRKRK